METVMTAVQDLLDKEWAEAVEDVFNVGKFMISKNDIAFYYLNEELVGVPQEAQVKKISLRELLHDEFDFIADDGDTSSLHEFVEGIDAIATELKAKLLGAK